MAFVNERPIESNEWEKYGLPALQGIHEFTHPSTCTIDHERNIYLLKVARQMNPDYDHIPTRLTGWFFFWRGHELWVELELVEGKGKRKGPGWARFLLSKLCPMSEKSNWMGGSLKRELPVELKPHREEILKDLYDALVVYKKAASEYTTYEMILDLAEGARSADM
jgi:hypothetical protein